MQRSLIRGWVFCPLGICVCMDTQESTGKSAMQNYVFVVKNTQRSRVACLLGQQFHDLFYSFKLYFQVFYELNKFKQKFD